MTKTNERTNKRKEKKSNFDFDVFIQAEQKMKRMKNDKKKNTWRIDLIDRLNKIDSKEEEFPGF